METMTIVTVRDIYKSFPIRGGILMRNKTQANVLNGVSLSIRKGEIFGLAGESGCGKSTLAKLIVKLIEPSSGLIRYEGRSLDQFEGRRKKDLYDNVQMIFQDPYSSLNPRLRVKNIVGEMLRIRGVSKEEETQRVGKIISEMGLSQDDLNKYPHEFSGGQRQRIAISRALILGPKMLIADEPVSALDSSTRIQIISLMRKLKERHGLTILFISHDLDTIFDFCDRVAVMYLGKIAEIISAKNIFAQGRHPYLKAMIDSMPVKDPLLRSRRKNVIKGEVPGSTDIIPGCPFHPRCLNHVSRCVSENPPLTPREDQTHLVACHCV